MDGYTRFPATAAAAAPDWGAAPFIFDFEPFVEARKQSAECKALSIADRQTAPNRASFAPAPGFPRNSKNDRQGRQAANRRRKGSKLNHVSQDERSRRQSGGKQISSGSPRSRYLKKESYAYVHRRHER